jgi:hypothetical protein
LVHTHIWFYECCLPYVRRCDLRIANAFEKVKTYLDRETGDRPFLHELTKNSAIHRGYFFWFWWNISCLKRIKSDIRITTWQTRLSSLSVINVHSEIARKLTLSNLIGIFASKKERKLEFF